MAGIGEGIADVVGAGLIGVVGIKMVKLAADSLENPEKTVKDLKKKSTKVSDKMFGNIKLY